MRVVGVMTNETCDLQCSFCDARRPHERASVAGAAAIEARLAAADEGSTIRLTGGEPTLRSDLPGIVARARRRAARVVLDSHGANLDEARVQALAEAGLHAVVVHLPASGDALDRVTGGRDVWRRVLQGIAALRRAEIGVEICIPIAASNHDVLAAILPALAEAEVRPDRVWIRPILRAPSDDTLLPADDLTTAIEGIADQARRDGLTATLDPATFVPPCQLPHPGRVAHLYRLNAGGAARNGYERAPACTDCRVADRCPGLPRDAPAFADATPHPLSDDRTRRRLTLIDSPAAQAERELVTHELYRRPDGTTAEAHVIRIGFRCNQACRFCFVSTHLPSVSRDRVTEAIETAASRGAIVVLSGGEPTLDPDLGRWVALAKARGAPEIELQTNATRLGRPDAARSLADAGVDIAFVSLHAATAEISDAITGAPGTFDQTLAGLDALAVTSIAVRINYVLCRPNAAQFPAFVDLVATRWPRAAITVSFVGTSTDLVPRTPDLVPPYAEVLPPLREGLRRAESHGLVVDGFDSMCGLPLCLAPVDASRFAALAEPPPDYDGGEFIHPPPCDGCSLRTRCFGLRRGYADLYGWDELRPVFPEAAAPFTPG